MQCSKRIRGYRVYTTSSREMSGLRREGQLVSNLNVANIHTYHARPSSLAPRRSPHLLLLLAERPPTPLGRKS